MFVGRERELAALEERYRQGGFQCIVIYGRRRIGKTSLIRAFCRGKKHIFFTGMETGKQENLENLSQSIYDGQGHSGKAPCFARYEDALGAVALLARQEKLVLVLDEYPYLAKAYPGISSLLQVLIDRAWRELDLFVILCGSSMSFMERQVLGRQSPLFGRRSGQIKLGPFTYFETKAYFPQLNPEDLALVHGITGGVPQYLAQIRRESSVTENIKRNFFDPMGYLFEEPSNLLKQELREPALYNAVLQAVAGGATCLSQIAGKASLDTGAASEYLKNLISLGLIKREQPLGEKASRKSIYRLADNMFRFWYRFVPGHYSQIQNGLRDMVMDAVEPHLSEFMGQVFEELCQEWLWRENAAGRLAVSFQEVGRWWGANPRTKAQEEIDLVASRPGEAAIFAECKWRNEPIEAEVLGRLMARAELFPLQRKHFMIFAKRSFTAPCREMAEAQGNVRLVSWREMM